MKRIVCFLLAIISASLLVGCSGNNAQQDNQTNPPTTNVAQEAEQEFDLESFKNAVSQCQADINDASILIANMGTYEYNFWKALGSLSDSMTESAYEWLAENSDATKESVETAYESIRQQYRDITLTEYRGKEAEEIYSAFDSVYQAYNDMYNLVTNPTGSLTDFATDLNNYIEAIQRNSNDLSLFLEQVNKLNLYPSGSTSKYLSEAVTTIPDILFTTTAEENGLAGTVYLITADIIETKQASGLDMVIAEYEGQQFAVVDYMSYAAVIDDVFLQTDPAADYSLPPVNSSVDMYLTYRGFSGTLQLPIFFLGANEYCVDAIRNG